MKDAGDWLKQMTDLQQQYWNGWRDVAGKALEQVGRKNGTPWHEGLEIWNRATTGGPKDVIEHLMAHGRQYLQLLQGLTTGKALAGDGTMDVRRWLDELREVHLHYGRGLVGGVGQFPWFGGIDPAQIEQLVKSFASEPMRSIQSDMRNWLGLPTFGLTREHQERNQALLRAWFDYQNASARYNELLFKSAALTLDRLEDRLSERDEPGRRIESARTLYDLWIDAAEEAFTEVAMGAEYREVYGELIDTQMRVRSGLNAEIERLNAQFDMPTRSEIDSMAQQLHALKAEVRKLRAGIVTTTQSSHQPASTPKRVAHPAAATRAVKAAASSPRAKKKKTKKTEKTTRSRRVSDAPSIRSTARKSAQGN